MNIFLLLIELIIAIMPVFLVGFYYYKKDTIKEPSSLLRKMFLSGILSALIVIFGTIYVFLLFPQFENIEKTNNLFLLLLYCFIVIATLEELSKFLMIYKISYNNKEFDQAYDIILYSVFVGLGFACFENITYIINSESTILLGLLRGITAIPAHTCFQTLMGYYLYKSKLNNKYKYILLSIIVPILLHGLYDFIVFSNIKYTLLIFITMLIIVIRITFLKLNELIKIDIDNLKK